KLSSQEQSLGNLQACVKENKISLEESTQYNRTCFNVEIHNIPQHDNENLEDIAVNIAKKLNLNIEKPAIAKTHRLPHRNPNTPAPIILQLNDRRTRDLLFNTRKTHELHAHAVIVTSTPVSVPTSTRADI